MLVGDRFGILLNNRQIEDKASIRVWGISNRRDGNTKSIIATMDTPILVGMDRAGIDVRGRITFMLNDCFEMEGDYSRVLEMIVLRWKQTIQEYLK